MYCNFFWSQLSVKFDMKYTTLLNKEQELYDYLSRHVIPFFLYMKKHLQVLYLKLICSHYTHTKKIEQMPEKLCLIIFLLIDLFHVDKYHYLFTDTY